jgi:DNA repair exonuclease SbcCD nuclease subunit
VHIFPKDQAATFYLDDIAVALHGRSFARQDVTENLALSYPAPQFAQFNIGLLHTACEGSEGHHARYAPCTPEQLRNHGYDYWALGHVHAHAILSTEPHIVYPGNLQGRHPRETGPKGAVLVTVSDGRISDLEHRALDVVRWAAAEVDISAADDHGAMLELLRAAILVEAGAAEDRPLALRLTLTGATRLHGALLLDSGQLRQDVEALLTAIPNDVWLEKLRLSTQPPPKPNAIDPTVAGQLDAALAGLAEDAAMQEALEKKLNEIRAKLPAHAHADEFAQQMRADILTRAAQVARSLVSEAGHENQ